MGGVDEAVEDGIGQRWITEHLEMPQRLTGESLRSGSSTRIIPFLAIAIRSVTEDLDGALS